MQICAFLTPERIEINAPLSTKKQVLIRLAELISEHLADVEADDLFTSFITREKLGSTAIGHGIAIPHIRSPHIQQPIAAFIRLKHGIDFEAEDQEPVDLIFALAVPQEADEQHLAILAELMRLIRHGDVRQRLRQVKSAEEFYQQLMSDHVSERQTA